jgi:hypothetical protein
MVGAPDVGVPWQSTVRYVGRWSPFPSPPGEGWGTGVSLTVALSHRRWQRVADGSIDGRQSSWWWVGVVVRGDGKSMASVCASAAASMTSSTRDVTCVVGRC